MAKSYHHFGGMCWPLPGDANDEHEESLEWRLRYAQPVTQTDHYHASSIVAAYRELITMSERRRRGIIRELRRALTQFGGHSTEKP